MKEFLLSFLQENKLLIKNLILGFTAGIVVLVFSILFSEILYSEKKLVKKGFTVEIIKKSAAPTKVENIDGVNIGSLPELKASSRKSRKKQVDIKKMIESANLKLGAKIFKKCAACHTVNANGANKIGPNLFKIVGRKKANNVDFKYSKAMKEKGGIWTVEEINQFLIKPRKYIKGTKMSFAGLKKDKDRANVIAYLKQQSK
jgi:cytochrome c